MYFFFEIQENINMHKNSFTKRSIIFLKAMCKFCRIYLFIYYYFFVELKNMENKNNLKRHHMDLKKKGINKQHYCDSKKA